MLLQKCWRWVQSKRIPDTPKTRKYISLIYGGIIWNLCILTYIYHCVDKGLGSTEAQKAALLKYHEHDTVRSITIHGLTLIEDKIIPSIEDQQKEEAAAVE